MRSRSGAMVALLLAVAGPAGAQEVRQPLVFPEAPAPAFGGTVAPALPISDLQEIDEAEGDGSFWKPIAIGAAAGGVAGGTAGYLLYPNVVDAWFSRWQWTGITAAQGALGGAAVGAVIAVFRRVL